MGRGPKAVTANGFMPGNVPVKPCGNTHGCNHAGPDQPGYGLCSGQSFWRAYTGHSSNRAHGSPLRESLGEVLTRIHLMAIQSEGELRMAQSPNTRRWCVQVLIM